MLSQGSASPLRFIEKVRGAAAPYGVTLGGLFKTRLGGCGRPLSMIVIAAAAVVQAYARSSHLSGQLCLLVW